MIFGARGGAIAGWKACFSNVSDRAGQEGDRLSCHTHILYTCSSLLYSYLGFCWHCLQWLPFKIMFAGIKEVKSYEHSVFCDFAYAATSKWPHLRYGEPAQHHSNMSFFQVCEFLCPLKSVNWTLKHRLGQWFCAWNFVKWVCLTLGHSYIQYDPMVNPYFLHENIGQ